jgi:hypothetical protein
VLPANNADVAREIVRMVDESGVTVPIRLDPEGHVQRLGVDRRVDFTFEYRGFLFAVRAEPAKGGVSVRIHANLGHLPYTRESAADRANALAIVKAAAEALGGRIRITSSQSILLLEHFHVDGPFEFRAVLAQTVSLLIQAKPYLELLSVAIHPPAFKRRVAPAEFARA